MAKEITELNGLVFELYEFHRVELGSSIWWEDNALVPVRKCLSYSSTENYNSRARTGRLGGAKILGHRTHP